MKFLYDLFIAIVKQARFSCKIGSVNRNLLKVKVGFYSYFPLFLTDL